MARKSGLPQCVIEPWLTGPILDDDVVLTVADVPGFTMEAPDPDEAGFLPEACFNGNALLLRIGRDDDPKGGTVAGLRR